jgi:hypothetical protein
MRTFLWVLGGFVLGGLCAGVIGISLPEIITISQAEGAYAMGVAFFWVPLGAITGALTALFVRLLR